MISLGPVFSLLGFAVVVYRWGPSALAVSSAWASKRKPRDRFPTTAASASNQGLVSIIVPARNEELNLPKILTSLSSLRDVVIEIIVVDDRSDDRTPIIASDFASRDARIRLIQGAERPDGWSGKNWACHQGATASRGARLLFTDADTRHPAASLSRALLFADQGAFDLISAIPFHVHETFFEKLLGPFHLMVLLSSSAFSKPRRGSLFAIGQYLLFKRTSYEAQGGHEAIRESLADDLDLAEACLARGGNYGVEASGELFEVRMYDSFSEWLAGWRRIFRLGFPHATILRVIEIFLVIACLTESFRFFRASPLEVILAVGSLLIVAVSQNRYGRFTALGAVLAPIGIGLFVYVSLGAFIDRIFGRDLRWRGRSYKLSK